MKYLFKLGHSKGCEGEIFKNSFSESFVDIFFIFYYMEYQFVYSVIANGTITNTTAYGGHCGDTAGSTVPGNAVQDSAGVSAEITGPLTDLKNAIIAGLTTPSTTYTFPATFSSYTSSGTWYTIPSGASGVITLAAIPSDAFYIYNSGDMNLENITFKLSDNPQSYNMYFVSGGIITLSGVNYGNFIANQVNVAGAATVYGSVSALISNVSGPLTVHMGCPQYAFTYAAISNYQLISLIVNGGKYHASTYFGVDATNSTLGTDFASELTNLESFSNELAPFLGNTIYQNNIVTTTTDIYPISTNNWYTLGWSGAVLNLNFQTVTGDDVYYFVNIDPSGLSLENMNFVLNGASPYNIYMYSDNNITLTKFNYGNFITEKRVFVAPYDDAKVTGTVSAIVSSSASLVNNYGSYKTTINFVTECFMKGTKILTDRWYVPVEELKIGDLVITHGEIRDKCYVADVDTPMPIVNIHTYNCGASMKTSPIVITKNSFAPNKPFDDLYVSRKHRLIDRKGKLYPSCNFVNGTTIYQDPTIDRVTYYHIELASHRVITANGVMAESYNTPPRLLNTNFKNLSEL
jgi:hypothetical protein